MPEWGSVNAGTWVEDNYTMEVVFMDEVVAVIPFSIGKKDIERISEYEALLNEDVGTIYSDTIKVNENNENKKTESSESTDTIDKTQDDGAMEVFVDDKSLEEILSDLDSLIGLENIKIKLENILIM